MPLSESLRDIRLFVAAYEERSFTAAASRENATQSGVSQHIRKLEEFFAVKLFARDSSGVLPTPAGDSYYRHCIEVLRSYGAATRAVRAFSKGGDGAIVVGLMPTMTRCVLAPALVRFIDQHPNIVVRVVEGFSASLTQQVQSGELDFAIVPAFSGGMGLKSRLFLRTPELLVTRRGYGLAGTGPVRLGERPALKLVVPTKGNTRRELIETYLMSHGVKVDRLLELDAMMGSLDFVARTDWSIILPGLMMAGGHETDVFDAGPIADPPFWLDLILIEPSRRPLSVASALFLDALESVSLAANAVWTEEVRLSA